jgi:hypothetical protein
MINGVLNGTKSHQTLIGGRPTQPNEFSLLRQVR